jgi:hypothetical protein
LTASTFGTATARGKKKSVEYEENLALRKAIDVCSGKTEYDFPEPPIGGRRRPLAHYRPGEPGQTITLTKKAAGVWKVEFEVGADGKVVPDSQTIITVNLNDGKTAAFWGP